MTVRLSLLAASAAIALSSIHFAHGADQNLVLEETFDTTELSPLWTVAGVKEELYRTDRIEPFPKMADHGRVLHYYLPKGVNEVTPAEVAVQGDAAFYGVIDKPQAEEFYLEWQEFYPKDHDFADGSQKLLRFTYWQEGEDKGCELTFVIRSNNRSLDIELFHPKAKDGSPVDITFGLPRRMPTERWVTLGVWCKLNTPGKSDGFVRAYMDAEQVLDRSSLNLRGADTRGWNQMWLGGNHSNRALTKQASSRFIDNVRWYRTKPESSSK